MAYTIRGQGNWQDNAELQALARMRGQKIGDWQTETTQYQSSSGVSNPEGGDGGAGQVTSYSRRYMDTPWGRIYRDPDYAEYQRMQASSENGQVGGGPWSQEGAFQFGLGRYANEHGSDGIIGSIDDNGVFQGFSMDRESNAEMNTWLAIMATFGVGAYAAGGAAVAGAGGSTAAGGGAAAAGLTATEAAQLGLAGASLLASRGGSGGDASASATGAEPNVQGPTPPPAPPILDYQDLQAPFQSQQNRELAKSKTNLNPTGLSNALYASGNLLLGA